MEAREYAMIERRQLLKDLHQCINERRQLKVLIIKSEDNLREIERYNQRIRNLETRLGTYKYLYRTDVL